MVDGWYVRKAGSDAKGPYPLERMTAGIAKLPSLESIEVRHATQTGDRWIPAAEIQQFQAARRSIARPANLSRPPAPTVAELITPRQTPTPTELSAPPIDPVPDAPLTIQHAAGGSSLSRFMAEGQDPNMVIKLYQRVAEICTREEIIEYMAIQQRPVANFSPDAVVLTNRRIMIFRQKLLGRMEMSDLPWLACHDVHIKEDILGATISVRATNGASTSVDWLPKSQARKVYRIAQEMEEAMIEHRRNREMEERRSGATNIVVNTPLLQATTAASPAADPIAKLSQLKQMLESGLITDQEFASKKQEILKQM